MIRPSQPAEGRTAPATEVTSARQPRRTPSSGANGISERVKAGKADDLAGDVFSRGVSMTTRAPTDIACRRPGGLDHQAAHADDTAVDLDAVEFVDLFGECLHDRSRAAAGCPTGPPGGHVRKRMVTLPAVFLIACLPGTLIIAQSSLGPRKP